MMNTEHLTENLNEIMNESEFLESYDSSQYDSFSVAVDLLVFTVEDDELKLVMVRRSEHPFKGALALPGVFVGIGESVDDAARRGILEEAGLRDIYFEQLYTFGAVDRDPRMRIVSVAYFALVPIEQVQITKGMRSEDTLLVPVDELLNSDEGLAFDHREIIRTGRERLKAKAEYTDLPFNLLPEEFTLPALQTIYEILLGKKLYKANFRRKIAEKITETDKMTSGDAHRPSRFYRKK